MQSQVSLPGNLGTINFEEIRKSFSLGEKTQTNAADVGNSPWTIALEQCSPNDLSVVLPQTVDLVLNIVTKLLKENESDSNSESFRLTKLLLEELKSLADENVQLLQQNTTHQDSPAEIDWQKLSDISVRITTQYQTMHCNPRELLEILRTINLAENESKYDISFLTKLKETAETSVILLWPVVSSTTLKNARSNILFFFKQKILGLRVARLVQESEAINLLNNSSCDVISSSRYIDLAAFLDDVFNHDGNGVNVMKMFEIIQTNFDEDIHGKIFLQFWKEFGEMLETWGKRSIDNIADFFGNKITQTISNLLKGLVDRRLRVSGLEQAISACTQILHELVNCNETLLELRTTLFNEKQPPFSFLTFFMSSGTEENDTSPQPIQFIEDFRRHERSKRETIIHFFTEYKSYFNEMRQNGRHYVYPEEYQCIITHYDKLAEFYFAKLNMELPFWRLIFLDETSTEYSCLELKARVEMFIDYIEGLRPKSEKATMNELAKILRSIDKLVSSNQAQIPDGCNDRVTCFMNDFEDRLKAFLIDPNKDATMTTNIYQRFTDVSVHMIERFLEDETWERAETCLFLTIIKKSLNKLDASCSSDSAKWEMLQEFQTVITQGVLERNETIEMGKILQEMGNTLQQQKEMLLDPSLTIDIWKTFRQRFEIILGIHDIRGDELDECAKILSESLSSCKSKCDPIKNKYLLMLLIATGENLKVIEINPNISESVLQKLEKQRSVLAEHTIFIQEAFKIPCVLEDFQADFDKDSILKQKDWDKFLEDIKKYISLSKPKEGTNEPAMTQNETGSLLEPPPSKYFLVNTFQSLLDLQKKWNTRLNSVSIQVMDLMKHLEELIEQLTTVSAEKQNIQEIFIRDGKTASENFDNVLSILEQSQGINLWNKTEELEQILNDFTQKNNSYVARHALLAYWQEVRKIIMELFRQQTAKNWKIQQVFRVSQQDVVDLREKIFTLAQKRLKKQTCVDDCLQATVSPVSYILLLSPFKRISLRRHKKIWIAITCFIIFSIVITFVFSNLKNFGDWVRSAVPNN